MCDTFAPRVERGAGLVAVERIPYFAEQIVDFLKDLDVLVLVGTKPPVSFFAYPGKPSWCTPETCAIHYLAQPHEDGVGCARSIGRGVKRAERACRRCAIQAPGIAQRQAQFLHRGQVIGHYLPEGAIISDEAATSGAAARFCSRPVRRATIISC
jgi:acetolactate synthase-1/2/3 large subunit